MAKCKKYAAVMIVQNKQVLLGKRSISRKSYAGYWDILGGNCEGNETFEAAMLREMAEETGLTAKEYTHYRTIDNSPHFIMEIYRVTSWTGSLVNGDPSEHELLQWFNVDDAKKLTFPEAAYLSLFDELV